MREREGVPQPAGAAAVPRTPARTTQVARILELQRTAGNAAVTRWLGRQVAAPADPKPDLAPSKAYSKPVELLQSKLNWHLGFLGHNLLLVDGFFGGQTSRAVRQVKRAYKHRPADDKVDAAVWALLDAPPRAKRTEGGPAPDYAGMLKDGLLDVTIAMGFDEHGAHERELPQLRMGLTEVRGFAKDAARAGQLRERARAAGLGGAAKPRSAPAGTEEWYVKEAVGIEGNLVVHCVVRVVIPASDTASGAAARARVVEGLNQSDAFLYAGHGRYGTGMDFDYKYRFEIDWDRHPKPPGVKSGKQIVDLDELVHVLDLGTNDATQIKRYKALRDAGAVRMITHSEGNVRINERSMKQYDKTFGGWLMSESVQGAERPFSSQVSEDRYRLWLFNGCTTKSYVQTLREDPNSNLGEGKLGIHGTVEPSYSTVRSEALLTYLDGALARETAEALRKRLIGAQAATGRHVGFVSSGFKK